MFSRKSDESWNMRRISLLVLSRVYKNCDNWVCGTPSYTSIVIITFDCTVFKIGILIAQYFWKWSYLDSTCHRIWIRSLHAIFGKDCTCAITHATNCNSLGACSTIAKLWNWGQSVNVTCYWQSHLYLRKNVSCFCREQQYIVSSVPMKI